MKTLTFLFVSILLPIQPCEASVSLSILEPGHNFFSGEKIERTILLDSDFSQPTVVVLKWQTLVRPAVVERGQKKINLELDEKCDIKVSLTMPEVKRRAALTWRIQLLLSGNKLLESELHYSVFPRDVHANVKDILSGKEVGLFDPQGKTRRILRKLDIEFRDLRTQLSQQVFHGDLVIIGSGVPDKQLSNTLLTLEEKVKEGLAIVCLEQSQNLNRFLIPVETVSAKPSRLTSSRISAVNHPAFREMEQGDLSNWRGDGVISRYPYRAPNRGNFRILARGQVSDLAAIPLIEVPHGDGKFIFCQILLTEKFEEEPVAQLLFQNVIGYALMEMKSLEPAAIFGDPESDTMKLLHSLKVAGPRNPDQLDGFALVILCADEKSIEFILRQDRRLRFHLEKFIQEGGSLLTLGLVPETLQFLKGITLCDISLNDYVPQKAIELESKSRLLWGIAEEDLKLLLQQEEGTPKYVLEFGEDERSKSLMRPAGIAKFLLGEGRIIVWQIPFQVNGNEANLRILSQLLTNFGVEKITESGDGEEFSIGIQGNLALRGGNRTWKVCNGGKEV